MPRDLFLNFLWVAKSLMPLSILRKLDIVYLLCVNELFKLPLQWIIKYTPTLVGPDIPCNGWLKVEMKSGTVLTAENWVVYVLPVICCRLRCVEEEAVRKQKEQKAGDVAGTGAWDRSGREGNWVGLDDWLVGSWRQAGSKGLTKRLGQKAGHKGGVGTCWLKLCSKSGAENLCPFGRGRW